MFGSGSRFRECVVGVAVPDITPDDVINGCDDSVCTSCSSFKSIDEVFRLFDLQVTAEGGQTRNIYQEQNQQFDNTQQILQSQSPFQSTAMNKKKHP